MDKEKILIAYYSHSGNTKDLALKIQKLTGGDLFEIKPLSAYPANYDEVIKQAQFEKENDIKPELIEECDVSGYDTVFIGTPVWWYTFASPVRTFLTQNDFTLKVIIPFCTHGGGGESQTFKEIEELCPNSIVKEGFEAYEKTAKTSEIEKWLKK